MKNMKQKKTREEKMKKIRPAGAVQGFDTATSANDIPLEWLEDLRHVLLFYSKIQLTYISVELGPSMMVKNKKKGSYIEKRKFRRIHSADWVEMEHMNEVFHYRQT